MSNFAVVFIWSSDRKKRFCKLVKPIDQGSQLMKRIDTMLLIKTDVEIILVFLEFVVC